MKLTRRDTMKRASEFGMVKAEGSSEAGRFIVLSTAPLPAGADSPSRFGIITTRQLGHAEVRNQMRRRVREILRAHGDKLARGLYVVVIVRKRATMAGYSELERDFLKLLARRERKQLSC